MWLGEQPSVYATVTVDCWGKLQLPHHPEKKLAVVIGYMADQTVKPEQIGLRVDCMFDHEAEKNNDQRCVQGNVLPLLSSMLYFC